MNDHTKIESAEQILDLLSDGMTLGSYFEYSETEYEAVYALGHSLYMQEQYLSASKYFSFLVAHIQTEKRYVNALASSLQMLGRYEEAVQYYCMASIMDIDDPLTTFHTAECFIALKQYEQAEEALSLLLQQATKPQWHELRERCQVLRNAIPTSTAPISAEVPHA